MTSCRSVMGLPLTLCTVGAVQSVTSMHNVIYVLCSLSPTILRFDATTHQRLRNFSVNVTSLMSPHDIVACERTSQLYIADYECVWRVSGDGTDVQRWLPTTPTDKMNPWTLSVTSAHVLVTLPDVMQLVQFDSGGNELRRIQLPSHFVPRHAIQSPAGTFIVSHNDTQLDRDLVSEVGTSGEVLRQFGGSGLPSLRWPDHLDVDSRGNVFVADTYSRRILLLDTQLKLRRVIVDERQLNSKPLRGLHYLEQTRHLLVALDDSVAVFDLSDH